MIESLFKFILNLSISSSIVILVILLARHILKNKIPKTIIYALWVIVLIRLVIPFGFESQYSVFNLIQLDGFENQNNINTSNVMGNDDITTQGDSYSNNADLLSDSTNFDITNEVANKDFIKMNIMGYMS